MGIEHLGWKAVGSFWIERKEMEGLVHRMHDFGVHSHLRRPLPGRACSWESPQCWLCRETGCIAGRISG